jgi:surfactin synthase thioesterase subunit
MHSVYSRWQTFFPGNIQVRSVAMPGRGFRFREPPPTDIRVVVAEIARSIEALPCSEVALFGDCSGAVIALEVAQALQGSTHMRVLHLFAAGIPDPVTPDPCPRHALSPAQFQSWAVSAGMIAPDVLIDTGSTEYFLKQIRADYQLVETQMSSTERLSCAISTFVGAEDPRSAQSFDAWSRLTRACWKHHTLASGHLVSTDAQHELKSIIADRLHLGG